MDALSQLLELLGQLGDFGLDVVHVAVLLAAEVVLLVPKPCKLHRAQGFAPPQVASTQKCVLIVEPWLLVRKPLSGAC